jgi:hydrogenase/urease accessory protein HupE
VRSGYASYTFTFGPALAMCFALVCLPSRAAAHLVTTGLGPVYDGIGHLLLTPEDLVPVLALSMFAGLRGATAGRRTLLFLPLAWLTGGLCGLLFEIQTPFPIPALSFLFLGALVAADRRMPAHGVAALSIALGIAHGFLNGTALQQGPEALGLIGIMATLFTLVALVSALVVSLERPWTRIVVRVLGSWIVASGILMLGWALRG